MGVLGLYFPYPPELGEENIREMSFDLFAYKRLKNVVSDCEDQI